MKDACGRLGEVLAALRRPEAVEAFLRELLSPGELHDLALRWELVELLAEGVPQRRIAARLGVSLCKITRGARILKMEGGAVAAAVAKRAKRKAAEAHGTRISGKSQD